MLDDFPNSGLKKKREREAVLLAHSTYLGDYAEDVQWVNTMKCKRDLANFGL